MSATFKGMLPWDYDLDIIECNVDTGVVDLHNECTLMEIGLGLLDWPAVHLSFRHDRGEAFTISFYGVRRLEFHEDAGESWPADIQAVETLYGIDYSEGSHGTSEFEIRTLLGVLTFRATTVEYVAASERRGLSGPGPGRRDR